MSQGARVTVIVSAELMDAANHVHVLLGKARRFNSYTAAHWTDGANDYAVSSGLWSEGQIGSVANPAAIAEMVEAGRRPEGVDLALAAQAQAAFELHIAGVKEDGAPLPIPQAAPGKIIAVVSNNPQTVLSAAGLQWVSEGD